MLFASMWLIVTFVTHIPTYLRCVYLAVVILCCNPRLPSLMLERMIHTAACSAHCRDLRITITSELFFYIIIQQMQLNSTQLKFIRNGNIQISSPPRIVTSVVLGTRCKRLDFGLINILIYVQEYYFLLAHL